MKKYQSSTFNKTVSLIVLTHLLFFIIIVLLYYSVLGQEESLIHYYKLLDAKNSQYEHEFSMSFCTIKNSLLLLSVLVFISLTAYLVFVRNNLFHPIKLITNALETGSKKCIKLLKTIPGEFSYIGNLFQDNDNHKYELISAKIKAEESERLKSTFLENLSHEIRTPMNAIIGFTDLMLTTGLNEDEKKEYLSIIHKSGIGLISIIEDLIEMSKIDTNQIVPNYTDIDLEKCLIELYNTIKVDIPKSKNIDFYIIESKTRLFYNVKVDEVKLKQIIINLVYNAIKFTEEGYVSFGYEILDEGELDFIEFTIKDTGIGISKENQKTIFERFKRVESDLTIEKGGLGLGLAITKAYVEMMGGTISICSNQNKGTIFTFKIPLKYDKTNKIDVQKISDRQLEMQLNTKTILIAEDDNINFLLIKKMLQVTNHEIIRAENGQVAVAIALENPAIDIVLMDIKMPIMNGYEAFEKITEIRPDLPIIAQTAHASEEDKEKVNTLGFTDYITKPINKELLLEMVSKYI
jgi:signal transduction histidine kinase